MSITDTYDKIAKFILTRNAMYGMFELQIRLAALKYSNPGYDLCDICLRSTCTFQ